MDYIFQPITVNIHIEIALEFAISLAKRSPKLTLPSFRYAAVLFESLLAFSYHKMLLGSCPVAGISHFSKGLSFLWWETVFGDCILVVRTLDTEEFIVVSRPL